MDKKTEVLAPVPHVKPPASDPVDDERERDIREQIERAQKALSGLCHGERFQMTIPADPARDTDIIIGSALRGLKELLTLLDAARAERDKLLETARQLRDALEPFANTPFEETDKYLVGKITGADVNRARALLAETDPTDV